MVIIRAGDAISGFASIHVDNTSLNTVNASTVDFPSLQVLLLSTHELLIRTQLFTLEMESIDHFLNIRSLRPTVALGVLEQRRTHGLLGQTHARTNNGREVRDIEGVVDDYVEMDDQLTGCAFLNTRFQC